jgi:hypothetical protein
MMCAMSAVMFRVRLQLKICVINVNEQLR